MTSVDILEHVALDVPCASCGDDYSVPLRHVLLSQDVVHESERMWDEGCPNYCREPICLPLSYARLAKESAVRGFERHLADAMTELRTAGLDVNISCKTN